MSRSTYLDNNTPPVDSHAEIMASILTWAEADENIRAVIVNGSSTRPPGSSDRFSDRDVQIIAADRAPLVADDAWIRSIAPIWAFEYLDNDDDFDSRLVFFEGARKVDFTIADRSQIDEMSESGVLDSLYAKGYTVLLDKDGITANLPPVTPVQPHTDLPTVAEFEHAVGEFWFEAAHMPTYLMRDELWVVKFRDWTMKSNVLRMLEWHAAVQHDQQVDVWYIGSKMKRWIDPGTWNELMGIFGHFDRTDSYRALVTMMDVFIRLTHDVAEACGFEVPASEHHIRTYVLSFAGEMIGIPATPNP
jgi:aminoglycoside 6-adenylyltransferase